MASASIKPYEKQGSSCRLCCQSDFLAQGYSDRTFSGRFFGAKVVPEQEEKDHNRAHYRDQCSLLFLGFSRNFVLLVRGIML